MIPTALAILIYQILAILGTEAVSQIVTCLAYKKRDLDYRLMYTQSPLDLVFNYNRFDKNARQKATIILLVCLSIALKFIPTIFTKFNETDVIYYDTTVTALDEDQANHEFLWPTWGMPICTQFTKYLFSRTRFESSPWEQESSFENMMNWYIAQDLHRSTVENDVGAWFRAKPNITSYPWDDRQVADPHGFTAIDGEGRTANRTLNAFGFRQGSQTLPFSGTLHGCEEASNEHNLASTHGLEVSYAKSYHQVCYPVFDTSLTVTIGNISSKLDAKDAIYRPAQLSLGTSGSNSFGVSIFNHNSTHMTMAVKKTAYLTIYTRHNTTDILLPNCSSEGKTDFANNFIDLPHNAVLCDLRTHLNNASLQPAIVQAYGRRWTDNYAINTVYTIQKGGALKNEDIVMVDFTLLQAFTLKGHLQKDGEHMAAYQSASGPVSAFIGYPRDTIDNILGSMDRSYISSQTIEALARMATMRVRWVNGDFSDFDLYQAQVLDAVQTTPWWIITVATLAVVFLLPQASRLVLKRIPEYSKDLRSLLLLTIERVHVFEGSENVKNVSIVLNDQDNKPDERVALLAVNGFPVTVGEKVNSLETRLLDEEMGGSEEQLTVKR